MSPSPDPQLHQCDTEPPFAPLRIAVLISGGGTTLRNLLEHIRLGKVHARVELVISSNPSAKGIEYATAAEVPMRVLERRQFSSAVEYSDAIFGECRQHQVQLAVMGGFLKHVPIPADFENRVVNIHPSLIPAFCGKGMYGHHVHEAVLEYGAKVSGCTVHFVDNQYDHGPIIMQQAVPVLDDDSPETLAARVFQAECQLFPSAIEAIACGRVHIDGRHVQVSAETK